MNDETAADRPTALEIARASYAAFARHDTAAVLADLDPEIEWIQAQGLPHGGTYHGIDEVRHNIFDPLDRDWWDGFTADPDEFIDAGDQVVVLGRYRALAKQSRRRLDVPYVHVWTIADGKVTRFRQFLDTAGWNAALDR